MQIVLKMATFGIDAAFLQPVFYTLIHSTIQIPVKTNYLKHIIDEIIRLSFCDGFFGVNFIHYYSPEEKLHSSLGYLYVTIYLLLRHPL